MPSAESPVTSPEMGRRRYNYYNANIINTPPPPPPPHLHPHAMLCNKRSVHVTSIVFAVLMHYTLVNNQIYIALSSDSRILDRRTRSVAATATIHRNNNSSSNNSAAYTWNWSAIVAAYRPALHHPIMCSLTINAMQRRPAPVTGTRIKTNHSSNDINKSIDINTIIR